jgi:hypothetical protein
MGVVTCPILATAGDAPAQSADFFELFFKHEKQSIHPLNFWPSPLRQTGRSLSCDNLRTHAGNTWCPKLYAAGGAFTL